MTDSPTTEALVARLRELSFRLLSLNDAGIAEEAVAALESLQAAFDLVSEQLRHDQASLAAAERELAELRAQQPVAKG